MFLIFAAIFLCVLSFAMGWTTLGWILGAVLVLFFFLVMAINRQSEKEVEEKALRRRQEKERQKAKREKKTEIYDSSKQKLIDKYGQPDKTILLDEFDLTKEIMAFGRINRIWLLGMDLPMGDILSCTFSDDQRVKKGEVTYETKTNTGNMAKRAVVGAVLSGSTGAVIGGTTAKKETIVKQGDDKIIHNYTVIVNINSLSNPIVRIPLGDDGQTVNEIVGLLNVIISRSH